VCTCGLDNHSMRGEPSSWKGQVASGTPYELPNFWESAIFTQMIWNLHAQVA
jgi:hypothetical protein